MGAPAPPGGCGVCGGVGRVDPVPSGAKIKRERAREEGRQRGRTEGEKECESMKGNEEKIEREEERE